MDRVSRALGLGVNRTEDEDSLQPNDRTTGNDHGETLVARSPGGGADDVESWEMVVAQRRGAAMAVTQPREQDPSTQRDRQPHPTHQQIPIAVPATQSQQTQPEEFSGIGTALKRQGHLNYEPTTVASELSLQRDIQGNTTKQTAFKDFATNYTQMRVYLAMVGEQKQSQ
jgi:hypothetical protein